MENKKGQGANKTEGNRDKRSMKEKWKKAGNKNGTDRERRGNRKVKG